MRLSGILLGLFRLLVPFALAATFYIYLYPAFKQCSFPEARSTGHIRADDSTEPSSHKAPFRLLALADPQLEGDTSLPDLYGPPLPSLEGFLNDIEHEGLGAVTTTWRRKIHNFVTENIPITIQGYRKRLDLWGNDLYLAHIYRTIHWWTDPTHVVVLGDLLGSQWISDEEFAKRTERFWNTVFRGGHAVPREITDADDYPIEELGKDTSWRNRIISVAGNHDIGYAGDITRDRITRFEDSYGRANWKVRFSLNSTPADAELRLVVLNSMNLDGPAYDKHIQAESVAFLEQRLHQAQLPAGTGTILLTHIPLYKDEGVCVDGPFFDYFPESNGGGVKEQNHLSTDTSNAILEGLIGPSHDRSAIILNGHDHEGCHVYHATPDSDSIRADSQDLPWEAHSYHSASGAMARHRAGVREITVRSMMGEFGGNAGLLSAWWDENAGQWQFEYNSCMFGVQHIWWAVHVFDLVVLGVGLAGLLAWTLDSAARRSTTDVQKKNN